MKIQDVKNELSDEKSLTENGAVGYVRTGKELLDINFEVSSMRHMSEDEIYDKFIKAFYEDKLLAIKWLYFLRDVRGGLGERRSFRVILKNLANDRPDIVKKLISITAEYGRYDDLLSLLDTSLKDEVVKYYYLEFLTDIKNCRAGKPISLLAKWLPSSFSKKKENKEYAKMLARGFNLSLKEYDRSLSILRNYSNVIECKMSKNEWDEIDYSHVPSKANILYNDAFMRRDTDRRLAYFESLQKGETKINSSVNFPHDIVHAYCESDFWSNLKEYDEGLEQLWKALPDYVKGDETTIVVADGSGSMVTPIDPRSHVNAIDCANALAVYFSERCKGEYKDKYITFSENPQLVDFSNCDTLRDKLSLALRYREVANTNIEAVFDLILNVAIKNGYSQEELPNNILILSDMEFDSCAADNQEHSQWTRAPKMRDTLFEEIEKKYNDAGYKMPSLAFWNLDSRTNIIPIKENENGVKLVSGFSPAVVKMVLSGETDPYKALIEMLNSERYELVEKTVKSVINKKNK